MGVELKWEPEGRERMRLTDVKMDNGNVAEIWFDDRGNSFYSGQIRDKETNLIDSGITCDTMSELYNWIEEHDNI